MEKIVTVAVDAMGGDNAPFEIIKGAVEAINERSDIKVLLVGDENIINRELASYKYNKEQLEVIHASQVITNDEAPVAAVRSKKDSSDGPMALCPLEVQVPFWWAVSLLWAGLRGLSGHRWRR